jgi:hypothetical protein
VESLSIHLTVGRIDYTTRYAEDLDGPTVAILKDEDTYGMMIERRSEGGWLRKFRYFELRKQDGQVIYLYRAERENGRQNFLYLTETRKLRNWKESRPATVKPFIQFMQKTIRLSRMLYFCFSSCTADTPPANFRVFPDSCRY